MPITFIRHLHCCGHFCLQACKYCALAQDYTINGGDGLTALDMGNPKAVKRVRAELGEKCQQPQFDVQLAQDAGPKRVRHLRNHFGPVVTYFSALHHSARALGYTLLGARYVCRMLIGACNLVVYPTHAVRRRCTSGTRRPATSGSTARYTGFDIFDIGLDIGLLRFSRLLSANA